MPPSTIAGDVLDHDDGVVDHEAGGDRQRHQGQIVERKAEQIHRAEGADQRQRHRQAGNDRARQRAQEHKDHDHHQDDGEASSNSTSATEARMVTVRSLITVRSTAAGSEARSCRQAATLDAVDDLDDVGAGLALHGQDDRRRGVGPGAELGVFRSADDAGDVRQPHRPAVAVGDDQVAILIGAGELVVGVDGRGLRGTVEIAFRRVDVQVADRGADVVDGKPVGGERLRVELNAHRRPFAAADADQSDAVELRDFLGEAGFAQIFQRRSAAGSSM